MSFLAPLFLLGSLAVGLPIVFHLIRRTTRERTVFSSLMFLLPTPPRLTRRSRLENILLLLLRCLVLCLLAFAFARPFFAKPVSPANNAGAAKREIILVDTSASMRRAGLWPDACAKAESLLRASGPADEVAVVGFDRQLLPVVTFEQWHSTPLAERAAFAVSRLKADSPGWAGTHLGNALISAAEMLADSTTKATTSGPRQLVLISDLQEGCHLDLLQGYEWPKGVELLVEPVKARSPNNAGLQLATDSEESGAKENPNVRVRVSNAALSRKEQFKLGWAAGNSAFSEKPIEVYVPPGQSRIVPVPVAGPGRGLDRIVLQGDDDDFDNTLFVLPPEANRSIVLYVGSEAEKDPHQPFYFLQRAFQETRRLAVQVLPRTPQAGFSASEAQNAALIIVTDVLPERLVDLLRQQAVSGRTILVVAKNELVAPTLSRLVGVEPIRITEGHPAGYAMLAKIDFRHPLFAPFADPRFSDFTKIHFWQYRRIDLSTLPGARVLAAFDNGDPALLEVPVGKGRVLVLASAWHPEDSQLALSTKFVPLLYSMLEESGPASSAPAQFEVGDLIPILAQKPGADSLSVKTPTGPLLKLAAGETNFSQTMTPGIYSLVPSEPARHFAVNLDAAESRTAPLPLDEFERLGAPVARSTSTPAREAEKKIRLQNAELENQQKLWRWFLVATMAVLLTETWLAGRTTRRQSIAVQANT